MAIVLMPYTIGAMVRIASTMDAGSTGPGWGLRDSGSSNGAAIRNAISTGTASKNTEPHQKWLSRKPPAMGPRAAPALNPAVQIAMARLRWRSSWNTVRNRDSVVGKSMEPNTAIPTRAANSHSALGAKAAPRETRPKPEEPMMSIFRRPIRSPRLPMGISRAARTRG